MKRSEIRGCRFALRETRIALRSIRATLAAPSSRRRSPPFRWERAAAAGWPGSRPTRCRNRPASVRHRRPAGKRFDRIVPRAPDRGFVVQGSRDEPADLIAPQRNKRAVVVLIELRAEKQHMDPRVVVLEQEEQLQLEGSEPFHDLALARGVSDPQWFSIRPDDRVRLENDDPVLVRGVVAMQWNEMASGLVPEECHGVLPSRAADRQRRRPALLLAANYVGGRR